MKIKFMQQHVDPETMESSWIGSARVEVVDYGDNPIGYAKTSRGLDRVLKSYSGANRVHLAGKTEIIDDSDAQALYDTGEARAI